MHESESECASGDGSREEERTVAPSLARRENVPVPAHERRTRR